MSVGKVVLENLAFEHIFVPCGDEMLPLTIDEFLCKFNGGLYMIVHSLDVKVADKDKQVINAVLEPVLFEDDLQLGLKVSIPYIVSDYGLIVMLANNEGNVEFSVRDKKNDIVEIKEFLLDQLSRGMQKAIVSLIEKAFFYKNVMCTLRKSG